jgi:acetoin utilization deacetylase AcuC-like enzyme
VLCDEERGVFRQTRFAPYLEFQKAPRAALGDVLRVHEWAYVNHVIAAAKALPASELRELDGDTTISAGSWEAALRAAGAGIAAVDSVVSGRSRNAFCAVRPPGHHAGPDGIAGDPNNSCGKSLGFCLLNNVAVAAAYAMHVHRDKIRRVAILDFDVHHGDGTESIVRCLKPRTVVSTLTSSFCTGTLKALQYKPWLGDNDSNHVLLASVHGFDGQFFPATGKTDLKRTVFDESNPLKNLNQAPFEYSYKRKEDRAEKARTADEKSKVVFHKPFLNLGLGKRQKLKWRRAWRDCILPRVLAMRPDLIFMSAGFDGHHRDTINNGFLGLEEDDYAWLTNATMRVANVCCNGRVVSMLEGGYRIQGGPASPFARSAAAHVQALCDTPSAVKWNTAEANIDTELDNNADSNLPLADNLFGDTSDLFSSPAVVPALTAKKRSRSSDPIPSDLHEVRGNGSSNGGSSSRVGQSDRVLFTEPVPAPATEVKFAASAVGGPVSVSNPQGGFKFSSAPLLPTPNSVGTGTDSFVNFFTTANNPSPFAFASAPPPEGDLLKLLVERGRGGNGGEPASATKKNEKYTEDPQVKTIFSRTGSASKKVFNSWNPPLAASTPTFGASSGAGSGSSTDGNSSEARHALSLADLQPVDISDAENSLEGASTARKRARTSSN